MARASRSACAPDTRPSAPNRASAHRTARRDIDGGNMRDSLQESPRTISAHPRRCQQVKYAPGRMRPRIAMSILVLATSSFVQAQLDALRTLAPKEIFHTEPDTAADAE